MKLDRNVNTDKSGKYALIKVRKLKNLAGFNREANAAIATLEKLGLIHWGNESPGDQFFVMKYKDKFAHEALARYAAVVEREAIHLSMMHPRKGLHESLFEYSDQIRNESRLAAKAGNRIPD